MKLIAWRIILPSLFLPLAALAANPVTECGQTLHTPGTLEADLDCTSAADPNIYLMSTGLDLAGHTLTANIVCPDDPIVRLAGRCRVSGPGTVHGCVDALGPVKLANATFSFNAGLCEQTDAIIRGFDVFATDVEIVNSPGMAIHAWGSWGSARARIFLTRSRVDNCNGSDGGDALWANGPGWIKLVDSTVSNSGSIFTGGRSSRVSLLRSVVEHSSWDAVGAHDGGQVSIVDSSVTDGAGFGVSGNGGLRLTRSQILGSCRVRTGVCADIATTANPKMRESDCGTSYCTASASTCGVCAND